MTHIKATDDVCEINRVFVVKADLAFRDLVKAEKVLINRFLRGESSALMERAGLSVCEQWGNIRLGTGEWVFIGKLIGVSDNINEWTTLLSYEPVYVHFVVNLWSKHTYEVNGKTVIFEQKDRRIHVDVDGLKLVTEWSRYGYCN